MKRLLLIAITVGAFWSWAGPAQACSCAMLEPNQMLEFAPVAFIGTIDGAVPGPDLGQHTLTFTVDLVLAGEVPAEVDVTTADNSAGCGIDAALGSRMGVFASVEGGRLSTGLCSVTDPEVAIKALGPGYAPTGDPTTSTQETPFDWPVMILGGAAVVLVGGAALMLRRR
ncbi:MAG: hypothetical protein ACT4OP_08675 [Actinomycetota bacterium]